jgi:hypothetical protein
MQKLLCQVTTGCLVPWVGLNQWYYMLDNNGNQNQNRSPQKLQSTEAELVQVRQAACITQAIQQGTGMLETVQEHA